MGLPNLLAICPYILDDALLISYKSLREKPLRSRRGKYVNETGYFSKQ